MAEDRYVSLAEVKEMLTVANEERGELIPSLKAAKIVAEDTCPLTKDQADELVAKLGDVLSGLDLAEESKMIIPIKIADTLPLSRAEVRALFTKERGVTLSDEMYNRILDTVAEYAN